MRVIDAHVHVFPDRLFEAIWKWFDDNAWKIRQKLYADAVLDSLEAAGCHKVVGLLYAHRPGMAEELNRWIGDLARRRPLLVPGATVHPLDQDLRDVLRRAKETHGARVVKQHCHVLSIAPDDPIMFPLYEACIDLKLPLNLHVGNGPKLRGYQMPTDRISGAARTEKVLELYPELRLIVPHLGMMEEDTFFEWLDRFPNLYLDTAMSMVPFLDGQTLSDRTRMERYPGRVVFGTDFPNIPYGLETERDAVAALSLSQGVLDSIFHEGASRLFNLD